MSPNHSAFRIKELEQKLGYTFKDPQWVRAALTHRSFAVESLKSAAADTGSDLKEKDNERLEFLGDAVLQLGVSALLFKQYSNIAEGELSKRRSSAVNEQGLAIIAQTIDLGSHIQFGKGEEKQNGKIKKSILAGAFEALIAAIFLDSDYATSYQVIERLFLVPLANDPELGGIDYKSRLQERTQSRYKVLPEYVVVSAEGRDHEREFRVEVMISGKKVGQGTGASKKEAAQKAARAALAAAFAANETSEN